MNKFKVCQLCYLHSGKTDPYLKEVGIVEAPSSQDVPAAFAQSRGFPASAAVRWFDTMFRIGSEEYRMSPT